MFQPVGKTDRLIAFFRSGIIAYTEPLQILQRFAYQLLQIMQQLNAFFCFIRTVLYITITAKERAGVTYKLLPVIFAAAYALWHECSPQPLL